MEADAFFRMLPTLAWCMACSGLVVHYREEAAKKGWPVKDKFYEPAKFITLIICIPALIYGFIQSRIWDYIGALLIAAILYWIISAIFRRWSLYLGLVGSIVFGIAVFFAR